VTKIRLELHRLAQLAVKRAERLIAQQHRRPHHQRPRQRHTLLLAARELRRPPRLVAGERHLLERARNRVGNVSARKPAHAQPEGDVPGHGAMREQRVGLEDHAEVAAVHRHVGHVSGADVNAALVRRLEAGDHAQRRGLAAAGRPEQREELAGRDRQMDAVNRALEPVETFAQALEADGGGAGGLAHGSGSE